MIRHQVHCLILQSLSILVRDDATNAERKGARSLGWTGNPLLYSPNLCIRSWAAQLEFAASWIHCPCRRRFAVCTLFEQSRSIFLMSAATSSQSIMMSRKQSLFPVFSAIILHSAIHPARPNVGSPSVFHFEKSNRLMPVSGPQALHKLAFGRQRGTQAVIWAGVSFSHASSHWRRCSLI